MIQIKFISLYLTTYNKQNSPKQVINKEIKCRSTVLKLNGKKRQMRCLLMVNIIVRTSGILMAVFPMPASPSPMIVPMPFSNPEFVDPEEAFIASLASCHMLFFLHFAADKGIVIERYTDNAIGKLAKNDDGKLCITGVTLKPEVILAEQSIAHKKSLESLHHQAHEACFLARSVNFEISVECA